MDTLTNAENRKKAGNNRAAAKASTSSHTVHTAEIQAANLNYQLFSMCANISVIKCDYQSVFEQNTSM